MTDSTLAPRHVAFDWGGVFTIGTFDGRSTQNIADRSGVPVERVRESYFRHVRQLEVGEWTLPQFWSVMQEETGITLPYDEFEALYLGSVHDNLPMYATLAALPRSVRVGLLSNNYPVVSDHLRRDPRFARFDALVFSNELRQKNPTPTPSPPCKARWRCPPPGSPSWTMFRRTSTPPGSRGSTACSMTTTGTPSSSGSWRPGWA